MLKQVLTQMWQALRQRTMAWGARPRMVIVAVATLVLVVAAAAVTLHPPVSPSVAEEKQRAAEDPVPTVNTDPDEGEGEETADVENAVDFSKLKEENQDIYAWITIPGTNVNNPVLQSSDDDTYYLDHNRSGKASPYGAIFSQSMNALDFSDPVTVLYGHNTDDPIHLFRSLHNFEDANFFAEHDPAVFSSTRSWPHMSMMTGTSSIRLTSRTPRRSRSTTTLCLIPIHRGATFARAPRLTLPRIRSCS